MKKLASILQNVKEVMDTKLKDWENQYESQDKWMNLVDEITDIHMRIILKCAFGVECNKVMVAQYENGREIQKPLG